LNKILQLTLLFYLVTGLIQQAWCQAYSDNLKKVVKTTLVIRQKTQEKDDTWVADKKKLKREYENLLAEKEELIAENEDLTVKRDSCRKKNNLIKKNIAEIDQIRDELGPYLLKVAKRLDQDVKNSLPFLQKKRDIKVKKLKKIIDDPAISVSEKYSKVMEALYVEAEYGHKIKVYRDKILFANEKVYANILSIGRILLFCQTIDEKTTGFYNMSSMSWEKNPIKYNRELNKAFEFAYKRRSSTDLLTLPVGRLVIQ